MKAHGMLFNADMVRALLREIEAPGTGKTQTRRAVRHQPRDLFTVMERDPYPYYFRRRDYVWDSFKTMDELIAKHAPIAPGDRIWVRETFRVNYEGGPPWKHGIDYHAGGNTPLRDGRCPRWMPSSSTRIDGEPRWAPSIHMPRWASRITLDVTEVRVEQDISTWVWVYTFTPRLANIDEVTR